MLTVLTASALRWMERHRQRAALRRLLDYDDSTLEDMGLRRPEIERALRLPFEADVMQEARRSSGVSLMLDRRR